MISVKDEEDESKLKSWINRRTFLKWSTSVFLTGSLTSPVMASIPQKTRKTQLLSFYNIHTQEVLKTGYRVNGKLVPHAMRQINHILRDYRTGEIKPVDPKLLDILYRIVLQTKPHTPISIISGYRSPRTNEALRKRTTGVARKSLHIQGRAIDIRLPGIPTPSIRKLAIDIGLGGVGYYPKSDFVHLDTGRFRTW